LPLLPVSQLLEPYAGLLARIRLASGASDEVFDRLYMSLIRNLAAYVQTIPATRSRHFSQIGGLLGFSLETGFLALQMTDAKIFAGHSAVERRHSTESCWRYASFLAGLLCEVGLVCHASVYTLKGERWEALIESMTEWANRMEIEEFHMHWTGEHDDREDDMSRLYSGMILPKLATREQLSYIASQGREIVLAMNMAITGQRPASEPDTLRELVREARSTTIDHYERRNHGSVLGSGTVLPLEHYILDAIRRLTASRWLDDGTSSPIVKTSGRVYIDWSAAVPEINKLLKGDGVVIPQDMDSLAEILVDHNLAARSTRTGRRMSMYWSVRRREEPSPRLCLSLDPVTLRLESEEDEKYVEVEPSPAVAVMTDHVVATTDSGQAWDATQKNIDEGKPVASLEDPSQSAEAVDEAQKSLPLADGAPEHRDPVRYQDEGLAGRVLLTIIEDLRNGKRKPSQDIFCDAEGVAIRFPETFQGYGSSPGQILDAMNGKGWVQPNPKRQTSLVQDYQDRFGKKTKVVRLIKPVSDDLLGMYKPAESETKNTAISKRVTPIMIISAIQGLYRQGRLKGMVKLYPDGKGVELAYPAVFNAVAEQLGVKGNEVSLPMLKGELLAKDHGRPVQRAGEHQFVVLKEQYCGEMRVAQSQGGEQ